MIRMKITTANYFITDKLSRLQVFQARQKNFVKKQAKT